MNHCHLLLSASAFVVTLMLCAPAHAQLFRAYLASDGNDINPCTLQEPCRLLPAALTAVANAGEIWMLDSANYNTSQVNITKSVTILAIPGALGSVVATGGGDAININTASVNVTLRNLVVVPIPGGGGVHGIHMQNGNKLTVENGVISNLAIGMAIRVSTPATVRIVNTVIRDNSSGIWLQNGATADISGVRVSGNSSMGIRVIPAGAATTTAAVSDSIITGNGFGISAYSDNASGVSRVSVTRSTITNSLLDGVRSHAFQGTTQVSVSESLVTANQNGVMAYADSAGVLARMSVIRSTVTNNVIGVRSESFAGTVVLTLGESMVTGNGKALSQVGTGATLESMGNNTIRQNTDPNEGTITGAAPS